MGLSKDIPRPTAIILMSAHFETDGVAVVTDPSPGMIYDFRGFSPALYEMVYPAPGSPALAATVISLLDDAGLRPRPIERRGFDHGAWTPLLLAWPKADITVVQVSIDPKRDAEWHYEIGKALTSLRSQGVLIIGSGHITHNLRAMFSVIRGADPDPVMSSKDDAFTTWFADKISTGDIDAILDWENQAPFVRDNHPTAEHLMPIFFALGAAGGKAAGTRIHHSKQLQSFSSDVYSFD